MNKFLTVMTMTVMAAGSAYADNEVIKIANGNSNSYVLFADVDSISFDTDGSKLYIAQKDTNNVVSMACSTATEITLINVADCPSKLRITYDGSSVGVENPFLLKGVTVANDGGYVTVNNTNADTELTTELTGATTDGAFTYNGTYKSTIVLDGVSITSTKGAAIDIECGKRINLELKKGTENSLTDCANGEQKAALYCKGHLEIDKAGTLNVTGKTAHAISAKEYLKLKKSDGIINILSAVKDGMHCKQYYQGNGFTVNIKNVGDDALQAELDGEENDDGIVDGTIIIKGGTYTINNSANGTTEGTETSTAKGLNADGNMQLLGGTINIAMTGTGGKGIRVEGTYVQGTEDGEGPALTVSTTGASYSSSSSSSSSSTNPWGGNWGRPGGGGPGGGGPGGSSSSGSSSKAIKVLGAVTVYGGTTYISTATNGAEGLESKTSIDIAGGNHYFKCYDDCINCSGIIKFSGGNTVCYSNGNDAVDSNYGRSGAITIAGGNVFAYTSAGSPEEGLDCDNNSYITVTGGIAVSAGGAQGGGSGSSQSIGSASQGYFLGSSPSSYTSSYYYTLCNTSGEAICTYKFEGNVSNSLSLLTAPNLGKGSVTVKRGTAAPTDCSAMVANASGMGVWYVAPTVTTTATAATVTAK